MKGQHKFAILSLFLSLATFVFAQKTPIKFGKIEPEELQITEEEKKLGAEAIVLADIGITRFNYLDVGSVFQMEFERITRIKIITKDGFKWGDVSIPFYHNSNGKEQVLSLKGFTYNLDGGKIEKSKLTNSSIFTEEINQYWDNEKFAMPDVKEGSIIEYSYTLKSEFYAQLREWEFQWDIPVKWSEYTTIIPEFFNYQPLMQGYLGLTERTTKSETVMITTTSAQRAENGRTTSSTHVTDNFQFKNVTNRYLIKDAPALKEEPFITTTENYRTKITHELRFIKFPNSNTINFMDSWEGLNKRFLESEDFGKQIGRTNFAKDILAPVAQLSSDEDKLKEVHKLIISKIKWDETYRRYTDKNLKKIFEDGVGSSAEINLMLTGFLRDVGIKADPVLVSTRSNGYVREQTAVSDQFNYVICRAVIGNKSYLIDATEPFLPIGVLPVRCLNGKGRIISETNPGWVSLTDSPGSQEKTSIKLNLDSQGNGLAEVERYYKGYSGYTKARYYTQKGHDEYITNLKENHPNWEISSVSVDIKDLSEGFVENYSGSHENLAKKAGPMLYINPILIERTESNPFASDNRMYPVEFGYHWVEILSTEIMVPDGFKLEELPQEIAISMTDKSATFKYETTREGNNILVTSTFQINRPIVSSESYQELREFWGQVVAKHAEQIVLKADQ